LLAAIPDGLPPEMMHAQCSYSMPYGTFPMHQIP
jgi:hypothetical protein